MSPPCPWSTCCCPPLHLSTAAFVQDSLKILFHLKDRVNGEGIGEGETGWLLVTPQACSPRELRLRHPRAQGLPLSNQCCLSRCAHRTLAPGPSAGAHSPGRPHTTCTLTLRPPRGEQWERLTSAGFAPHTAPSKQGPQPEEATGSLGSLGPGAVPSPFQILLPSVGPQMACTGGPLSPRQGRPRPLAFAKAGTAQAPVPWGPGPPQVGVRVGHHSRGAGVATAPSVPPPPCALGRSGPAKMM